MAEILDPLSLLLHLVNLVVLYLVLRKLLYKPVVKFLNERAARVQAQTEDLAQKAAAAQEKEAALSAELARIDQIEKQRIEKAEADMRKREEAVVAAANAQAQTILSKAQAQAAQDAKLAQQIQRQETVDLAFEIAEKVLAREITREDHTQMIQNALEKLGETK